MAAHSLLRSIPLVSVLALFLATTSAAQGTADACRRLSTTTLPATSLDQVQYVEAGAFTASPVVTLTPAPAPPAPPAAPAGAAAGGGRGGGGAQGGAAARNAELFKSLPAFCRVVGTVTTSPSSSIKVEVWLPASWNGKYLSNGYSFYGGLMDQTLLAAAVRDGYATATTDAGGGGVRSASFMMNQPEKVIDVGERAWHETTVRAKALAEAFYGRGPSFSYFEGCGGEGRQGLAAAQRYPGDFDGIAIGGLAHHSSSFAFQNIHAWQVTHRSPESNLTPATLAVLNKAALAACDARDGAADGLIQNPPACRFDPAVTQCTGSNSEGCLTAAQVESARQLYAPVVHARTGARISGSLMPGSELSWGGVTGNNPNGYAVDYFKYLVFKDPSWDFRTRPVNLDADVALASQVHPSFNPINPDLSAFVSRGAKLLIYGGWNDVAIPSEANVDYYSAVAAKMGTGRIDDSVRLFMVPGMGHCPGRTGANAVDFEPLDILQQWREKGVTPREIVATRLANGTEQGQMLVCPYPQIAVYSGQGSMTSASSFRCQAPPAR